MTPSDVVKVAYDITTEMCPVGLVLYSRKTTNKFNESVLWYTKINRGFCLTNEEHVCMNVKKIH